MRARKLAAALTAVALTFNTTGAAATGFKGFLDEDEIFFGFETKKPGKVENLRFDLNGVRLSHDHVRNAKAFQLVMLATVANAFGVGLLPFLGNGEFSVSATLGFLTNVGLTSNSLVAIEVDIPFDSNPLQFFLLKANPTGADLRITAANQNGTIGTPITLTDTRLASIRIQQTATELIFDARNVRGGDWHNVATIARTPSLDDFQLSFGASFLNPGALAVFDDVKANGEIFGEAEQFHLGLMYDYRDDVETARSALVHEGNAPAALAAMAALQTALLATALGIELDLSQGDFFRLTLAALAVRHLRSAIKEAGKVEKPLSRGQHVDALERIVRVNAFILLASLAMRGLNVRKIDDLCYFDDHRL